MTDRKQHIKGLLFDKWAKISFASLFLLIQVPAYHVYALSDFLNGQLLKSELVDTGFADTDNLQKEVFPQNSNTKPFQACTQVFPDVYINWDRYHISNQQAFSILSNPVDRQIDHTHHRIYSSSDDQPENG